MKKVSNTTIYTSLFCLFYGINVFITHVINSQYIVSLDNYEFYVKLFKGIAYAFSGLALFLSYRMSKKEVYLDMIIAVLFLISYSISKYSIIVFIILLTAKRIKFKYIIYSYMIAIITGILFVYITYLFDLYDDSYLDLYRDGNYRNILGYRFPTYFPNVLLSLYLCWIYLRKNHLTLIEMCIMLSLGYFSYFMTDTRTIFYATVLLISSILVLKVCRVDYKTYFLGKVFSFFTKYIFVILALSSICIQYFFDPSISWMSDLDHLLSGRIYFANQAISEYGFPLFGAKLDYVPMLEVTEYKKFFVIDCGFTLVLMNHGIIILALLAYGFFQVGKYISDSNTPYLGIVVIFFIAQMIVNPYLTVLDFNPFFFLLAYHSVKNFSKYV